MENNKFPLLYVDDEEYNLISFEATFRKEYKVYTAQSGAEGLEIMRNNDIRLVITDQRMPEMTGIEFIEKTIPEFPNTIRMILTGFSDIGVIVDALNNGGVFRYITKPWDESELRMTIENAKQVYELQKNNSDLMESLKQKVEELEQTLKLFVKYVPEKIVAKSLDQNQGSIFQGETMNVSVLFCDIRGFTPMSEELEPREVVEFLNDYYGIMSDIVKQQKGSVNQFVGDEIFAAFGSLDFNQDNEVNAVMSGIKMMEALPRLNEKYNKKFKREIQMGIGINCGEVVAGNVGSEERIRFSLTGDVVNTGKRIESLTIDHPNSIMISDAVYQKTKDLIKTIAWDPVFVKGKKEKILVYEVTGLK